MNTSQKTQALLEILKGINTDVDPNAPTTTAGIIAKNDWFASAPIRIPKMNGEGYFRTAIDVFRSPETTIKIHYWHSEDGLEKPHNHPWNTDGVSFQSHILSGGYKETVYWLDNAGAVQSLERTFRAGDVNTALYEQYHVVSEVLPNTITLMVCGAQFPNNEWGYLDIETGEYKKAEKTVAITELFLNANQHLKK